VDGEAGGGVAVKSRSARVAKVCEVCGAGFTVTAYKASIGRGRFCSTACLYRHRPENGRLVNSDPERWQSRFWRCVNKEGPSSAHASELGKCWIWSGRRQAACGYGVTVAFGRDLLAHRLSWFMANGSWPQKNVLHRCGNRSCVNPDHLFEGIVSPFRAKMKPRQILRPRKSCTFCGSLFLPRARHTRPARFCSRRCERSAWRDPQFVAKKFWSRVAKTESCWVYTGARSRLGYGSTQTMGRSRPAHHVSWWLTHGAWPTFLMHACDNPPCVNPEHLSEGDAKRNAADMVAKGRNARGERKPNSKLTDAGVRQILGLLGSGESISRIAAKYGVSCGTISRIRADRSWKHIPRTVSP
jgi:hypothetical protein